MMASAPSAHRVLEHFLATLDIGVTHITRCDIRDGWSVRFDACETASLHYCLDGCGTLDAGNGHRIALQPHSFVLMPPGVSYRLESAFESPTMSVDRARLGSWSARETAPTVKVGEAAAGVEMACGELRFATSTADPFRMLRHPIVTRFDGPAGLKDQFVMLLAESAQPGLGSRVLIEALLKQCLVMLLRRQMESDDAELSWTAAVADPRLLLALEKLFEHPEVPLSVQRLADLAGMSRSAFAAHFERAFGQTPMAMLRAVRLHKAAELLATTTLQISQVAHAVGFSSRSNFSQAFHKQHGVDPSGFRQRTTSRQRVGGN
ncbi:Transcriptional regulator, AraC-family [Cupriavidus necator]|uniref:AraC family transcriptional regulator n=1 Tax=Cupriavidus necator (strain ATCC 17699 / DSM 428 / KCTC 22496 / NCIMB 10442 / H16 / Stanier 337) TaxID=381666 RepID=Q0KAT4_CUPNH|nr:AraC family transcriptional regulator [Cupriavidus necator]QCC00746.1 AraC family transcriptional regulator [Cupriavidus necator H16]WKA42630.1 AraC family transcriptional regulator [Cupriavidus necator]CAJ92887.1 transcriptional regulator, AraC-family [Cupriavidus necator H16]